MNSPQSQPARPLVVDPIIGAVDLACLDCRATRWVLRIAAAIGAAAWLLLSHRALGF